MFRFKKFKLLSGGFFATCFIVVLLVNVREQFASDEENEENYVLFDVIDEHSDEQLLKHQYLRSPSVKPYNLSTNPSYIAKKNGFTWSFINEFLEILFNKTKEGFFVEAGALDGEFLSNTLRLEKYMNWSGILIEPDPYNYQELVLKNRKAWSSNTCLSDKTYAKKISFLSRRGVFSEPGGDWIYRGSSHDQLYTLPPEFSWFLRNTTTKTFTVQCFPLSTYLLALNRTNVDLISLDIQGAEMEVLKSFPFHLITVKVFVVENINTRESGIDFDMERFFNEKGYQLIACDVEPNYIYILKESFKEFYFPKVTMCNMTLKKL